MLDRRELSHRNGYGSDSDCAVLVIEGPRDSLLSRSYILNQKWRDAAMASPSQGQKPLELIAIRSGPGPGNRVVDSDTGRAKLQCIALKIVCLHAEIDQPLALLQRIPPTMVGSLAIEGDNFDVRAVDEGDESIVAAHRMLAAGNDSKPQLLIVFGCLFQIIDDDNNMIDPLKHKG